MSILYVILSKAPASERFFMGVISTLALGFIVFVIQASRKKIITHKINNNEYSVKQLTDMAFNDVNDKNIDEAILKFNKILEIDRDDENANLGLGMIHFERNEYQLSKKYFIHFFTLNLSKEFIHNKYIAMGYANYQLGQIYHKEGDFKNYEYYNQKAKEIKEVVDNR